MRLLLCCLSLLVAANTFAENEYWVAVGSFRELEVAEKEQSRAGSVLLESFSLQPADTDKGFYYRVVAGPFLSKQAAQDMIIRAKEQGFSGAWLLVRQRDDYGLGAADPSSSIYDSPLDEQAAPRFSVEESEELLDELRDSTGDRVAPLSIPPREEADKKRLLIEEAPEGYQLNKLKRDQAS